MYVKQYQSRYSDGEVVRGNVFVECDNKACPYAYIQEDKKRELVDGTVWFRKTESISLTADAGFATM
jgi:hypothetical protein